jgi:hypothetical protein
VTSLRVRHIVQFSRDLLIFCVFLFLAFTALGETRVVYNEERGQWSDDPARNFVLHRDMTIGKAEGQEHELFGRVLDVGVDSQGSIYVLDHVPVRVRVYDDHGRYLWSISQAGEGPGDLNHPSALALVKDDTLLVADRIGVSVFAPNGEYVRKFSHEIRDANVRSVRMSRDTGDIYLSCFEVFEQCVLHRFDPLGNRIASFCESYAFGQDVDVYEEMTYAGGTMDVDGEGVLYYCQRTPYEIRKYTSEGVLLAEIHRANDFAKPRIEKIGAEQFRVRPYTSAVAIVALHDGKFMTVVKPAFEPESSIKTIIDLFDSDGELLLTREFQDNFAILRSDARDRLYGVRADDFVQVVRYRVSFAGGDGHR